MHYSKPVLLFTTAFILGVTTPTLGQVIINEDFKIGASDGMDNDEFGHSVAIDNGIIAVGVRNDDNPNLNSGSAYLFDATTGMQLFKLAQANGAAQDWFGWSIDIDNGVVAVGSRNDDDNGTDSGSVYLFDAATGVELFKLLAIDGAAGDAFGTSVAIHNGIVAVGASQDDDNGPSSGSAYLFDASTGEQLFKLVPKNGASTDFFGTSIAIGNGIVAVGADQDDDNGSDSGSVYLFDVTTGVQIDKLVPSDGESSDHFGSSVAIDNGIVAVGAPNDDDDDNGSDSGSAYLFDVLTGALIVKLLPNDGAEFDSFGYAIGISNGVVAVGGHANDDNGSSSGSAYLFDVSGVQIAKLLASDAAAGDRFGRAIAINNGVVAPAAYRDDDNGGNSGSVYVFNVGNGPIKCIWDLDETGSVGTGDLLALFAQWGTAGPADFDESGTVDTADLLILFANWGPCK